MMQKDKYQYSVEIAGSCNLRCPSCPVGNMRDKKEERPTQLIESTLFYKIIDKISNEAVNKNCFVSVFEQNHHFSKPTSVLQDNLRYLHGRHQL